MAKYLKTTEDTVILKDLIAGREEAFVELYHRYYYRLLHVAINITKSQEVAEGIVHDVFTKIWTRREKLSLKGSFQSLIHTMVRNFSLNYLRDNSYRKGFEQELFQSMVRALRHAENEVWFNLFQEQVEDILERLPPRKRSIFYLSREDGMSHQEIGKVLGITTQAVSKHLSRTLEIIREQLERIDATDSK